jgi:hypothetical protein
MSRSAKSATVDAPPTAPVEPTRPPPVVEDALPAPMRTYQELVKDRTRPAVPYQSPTAPQRSSSPWIGRRVCNATNGVERGVVIDVGRHPGPDGRGYDIVILDNGRNAPIHNIEVC